MNRFIIHENVRPYCIGIDSNGYAYCADRTRKSGYYYMEDLLDIKKAVDSTIKMYKRRKITLEDIKKLEDAAIQKMEQEMQEMFKDTSIKTNKPDNLYLIHDIDCNLLKIGRSKNPQQRLKQIQTSCGNKLKLLCIIKGFGYMEEELHTKFSNLHKNGEWFYFDKCIIDEFNILKNGTQI